MVYIFYNRKKPTEIKKKNQKKSEEQKQHTK